MKKEGLILLALVLVFGFVVLGCGSTSEIPLPTKQPEWVEIFKLSDYLDTLTVGETDRDVIFDTPFLADTGTDSNVTYEVKAGGLEVTVISAWAGFDINNSAFNFIAGDTIEIKGTYTDSTSRQVLLNLNHAGWKPLQGWNPSLDQDDPFEKEFELEAGDVADIKAADPAAIRVRLNDPGAFIVEELIVSGMRLVPDEE